VDRIFFSQEHLDLMQAHVHHHLPEEACGMIGGIKNRVHIVLPITNKAHSPVRYYMDPVEMLHAFDYLDNNKLELIATFHSHPNGPRHPSETDIREFMYPGTAVIIWSSGEEQTWQMQAFMIETDTFREIPVTIMANP
jgi:[CysO sulfur-carrier protein]-S-L-cysteine hydrolase